MFHINTVKDNDINKVVNQEIVDGQMYVDEKPVKDSPFLVTSGGVKQELKAADDKNTAVAERVTAIEAVVPSGATADNKLVTSSEMQDAVNTGDEHEYVAPADGYEVGKYYIYAGVFCRCTDIEDDEATLSACGGILQTFNDLKGIIDDLTDRVAALENP